MNPELIIIHESIIKKENPEDITSVIPMLKNRSPLAIFSEKSNNELEGHLRSLEISEHFELIYDNLDQIVSQSNFSPEGIVFISDSLEHMNQAKTSGINFIAVEGENKKEDFKLLKTIKVKV